MISNYEKFIEQMKDCSPIDYTQINESLIKSWKASSVLRRLHYHKFDIGDSVINLEDNEHITITISDITNKKFNELLSILGYVNWFISELFVNGENVIIKNNNDPSYKWKIDYKIDGVSAPLPEMMDIYICIEKVHDDVIATKFDYVYHACDIRDLPKIKEFGLIPSNRNKWVYHPSRVYFCPDIRRAEEIAHGFKNMQGGNSYYTILEINLKGFEIKLFPDSVSTSNIKFHQDPDYEYGMYTYTKIPPNRIRDTRILV